ncbi:hypothetical protein J6590_016935 [Homalodisca vitripennis]|nr:hypothetical protein J6590_016935 [Homalodisca vitripennis]
MYARHWRSLLSLISRRCLFSDGHGKDAEFVALYFHEKLIQYMNVVTLKSNNKLQTFVVEAMAPPQLNDVPMCLRVVAGILPMDTICRIQTCIVIHQVLLYGEPQYMNGRFSYQGKVSQHWTCHIALSLHFSEVTLEFGRRSIFYFGLKLLNGLPNHFKELHQINNKIVTLFHDRHLEIVNRPKRTTGVGIE